MYNLKVLKALKKMSNKSRREFLKSCDGRVIDSLSEVCQNLLKGRIKMSAQQIRKLKRHRKSIRAVACKRNCLKKRRKIISQTGGFIGALIGPLVTGLSSLLGGLFNRN